jgi:hypothetical protein
MRETAHKTTTSKEMYTKQFADDQAYLAYCQNSRRAGGRAGIG